MNGLVRWLLKAVVVVALVGITIIFLQRSGVLQSIDWSSLTSTSGSLETYYQWEDRSGRVRITTEPPPSGIPFHQFKGSPGMAESSTDQAPAKSTAERSKPKIKVVSDRELKILEAMQKEDASSDCRWSLGKMINVKRQLLIGVEQKEQDELCDEFRAIKAQYAKLDCRVMAMHIIVQACE